MGNFFKTLGQIAGIAAPFIPGVGGIAAGVIGGLTQAGEARDAERAMMQPWNDTQGYRDKLLRALMYDEMPSYVKDPYSPQQENILLGSDLSSLANWKRNKTAGLRSDMIGRGIGDSSVAAGENAALEDSYHQARAGARADLLREETTLSDQRRGQYIGDLERVGYGTLGSQQQASQTGYQQAVKGLSTSAAGIGDAIARYKAREDERKKKKALQGVFATTRTDDERLQDFGGFGGYRTNPRRTDMKLNWGN